MPSESGLEVNFAFWRNDAAFSGPVHLALSESTEGAWPTVVPPLKFPLLFRIRPMETMPIALVGKAHHLRVYLA